MEKFEQHHSVMSDHSSRLNTLEKAFDSLSKHSNNFFGETRKQILQQSQNLQQLSKDVATNGKRFHNKMHDTS